VSNLLRWDPSLRYRAFVNRPGGKATVVSSRLVDRAEGVDLNGFLVVTDEQGVVCDLELQFVPDPPAPDEASLPAQADAVDEPLQTAIKSDAGRPEIRLDQEWLLVIFDPALAGSWYRLGEENVYLRIYESALVALAVAEPRDDADGLAESRSLDEIEGGRPEFGSVPVPT
jgi:hypothetical protein